MRALTKKASRITRRPGPSAARADYSGGRLCSQTKALCEALGKSRLCRLKWNRRFITTWEEQLATAKRTISMATTTSQKLAFPLQWVQAQRVKARRKTPNLEVDLKRARQIADL